MTLSEVIRGYQLVAWGNICVSMLGPRPSSRVLVGFKRK